MRHLVTGFSWILVIALTISATGCDQLPGTDRYEIEQDNAGRTIRLDKQTGEIAILQGDKLVPVKSHAEQEAAEQTERMKLQSLAAGKWLTPTSFPTIGVTSAVAEIMWRDGKMYMQVYMTPAPKTTLRSWGIGLSRFRINFSDASGFYVVDQAVPVENLTDNIDAKGKVVGESINWSLPLSRDAYESIVNWTLTWL